MDLPVAELARMADETIARYGGKDRARVFFKFACPACPEHCVFREPNVYYESGECDACGHVSPFTAGGFRLEIAVGGSFAADADLDTMQERGEP